MGICESTKSNEKTRNKELTSDMKLTTENFTIKKNHSKKPSEKELTRPIKNQKRNTISATPQKNQILKSSTTSPDILIKQQVRKSVKRILGYENSNNLISNELYENYRLEEDKGEVKKYTAISKVTKNKVFVVQIPSNIENKRFLIYMNEIELLRTFDHPQIAKYLDAFVNNNIFYLFKETSKERNLKFKLEKNPEISEYECGLIVYQLLEILIYLKKRNVVHRNIKPENILINDFKISSKYSYIKLSDFRRAKIIKGDEKLKDLIGTTNNIAPEVIDRNYNEKCDVWSVGIVLYWMLEKVFPFVAETQELTFKKIKNDKITFSKQISLECRKFIMELLEKNPEKRLSAQEAINHKWLRNQNISDKFNPSSKSVLSMIEKLGNACNIKNNFIDSINPFLNFTKEIFERQKIFSVINTNCDWKLTKDEILNGFIDNLPLDSRTLASVKMKNISKIYEGAPGNENRVITLNFKDFVYHAIDKNIILENTNALYFMIKKEFDCIGLIEIGKIFTDESPERTLRINEILIENPNYNQHVELDEFKAILTKILS